MAEYIDSRCVTQLTSCPICSHKDASKVSKVKTIHPNSSETVEYLMCRACKHRYHNPLPSQEYLSLLYSQGSRFVAGPPSEPISDSPEILARLENNIFRGRELGGLSVLEMGSGNGSFLRWIEQKGAKVAGIEPGPWGAGTPNTVADISEVMPQTFDVIVILDVLEHLSNPSAMLNDLRRFADAKTVLAAAFPNSESILSRLKKAEWRMVRPIGHLHYFSRRSIDETFRRAGWNDIEKRATLFRLVSARTLLNESYQALRNWRVRVAGNMLREALLGRDQWFVKATLSDA
jgi:2-polyprenyl-3-methyl-5-hydroxy-6-metoxy-1,4-benzoquinol methylase